MLPYKPQIIIINRTIDIGNNYCGMNLSSTNIHDSDISVNKNTDSGQQSPPLDKIDSTLVAVVAKISDASPKCASLQRTVACGLRVIGKALRYLQCTMNKIMPQNKFWSRGSHDSSSQRVCSKCCLISKLVSFKRIHSMLSVAPKAEIQNINCAFRIKKDTIHHITLFIILHHPSYYTIHLITILTLLYHPPSYIIHPITVRRSSFDTIQSVTPFTL